jgi:hypothetical protein
MQRVAELAIERDGKTRQKRGKHQANAETSSTKKTARNDPTAGSDIRRSTGAAV